VHQGRRDHIDLLPPHISIVPAAVLIPADKENMFRQAALDLERVICGIAEGSLSLDDAQAA
jgi:hypothetical protein